MSPKLEIKGISAILTRLDDVAESLEIKGISVILTRLDDVAKGLDIKGISAILTEVPKAWKLKGLVNHSGN